MSNLCASCNINDDDCLYKLINCYVCAKPYHITRVDKDEAVFHALKTYKNLSWQCDECSGSQVVNNNDRGLELIMKKLESMSSEIDQLKEKTVPKSTFSGLFQENGDNLRGSKRSAILNGNGDPSKTTPFGKRKRLESKVHTPAIIMGTGAVNNDLVVVQAIKVVLCAYASSRHYRILRYPTL
jgi:hypothetical protein